MQKFTSLTSYRKPIVAFFCPVWSRSLSNLVILIFKHFHVKNKVKYLRLENSDAVKKKKKTLTGSGKAPRHGNIV